MAIVENDLAKEILKIENAYAQIELETALKLSAQMQQQKAPQSNAGVNVKTQEDTKTAVEQTVKQNDESAKRWVVDYWPSWYSNWTRDDLRNTPDAVNVVNLAFALPDGKGSLAWGDDIHPACTKEVVKLLQKKNKLVLISIGGATAHDWNLAKVDINLFAKNIKALVDAYNLNGVDIDYESKEHREKLPQLIKALRALMPTGKYWITYAGWSIGAYGIKGHEHNEWDNNPNKGCDIAVLGQTKDLIDCVNVMSYDAFDPTLKRPYNPSEAIAAFSTLLGNRPDKVTLGILIGKQSWPQNTLKKTTDVQPWIGFAKANKFKGLMFWYLKNDVPKESGEPAGSFLKLC